MPNVYTAPFRAQTVALARERGVKAASKETGVHFTTIYEWLKRPDMAPIIERVDLATGDKIIAARDLAVALVTEGLPKMRPHDQVKALEVLDKSATLIEGRATSRVESMNMNINAGVCQSCGMLQPEPLPPEQRRAMTELADAIERVDPVALWEWLGGHVKDVSDAG
jgi:transposase-like protein